MIFWQLSLSDGARADDIIHSLTVFIKAGQRKDKENKNDRVSLIVVNKCDAAGL